MLKRQEGTTLLTLVLTIVVLLIIAAVAIAMILDELKYDPEPVQVESEKAVIVETDDANKEISTPTTEVSIVGTPEAKETPIIENVN